MRQSKTHLPQGEGERGGRVLEDRERNELAARRAPKAEVDLRRLRAKGMKNSSSGRPQRKGASEQQWQENTAYATHGMNGQEHSTRGGEGRWQ